MERPATAAWAQDQGLLRGWGLFETMLAVGSRVPLWGRHWARLREGARQLSINLPGESFLLDALQRALSAVGATKSGSNDASICHRVRLTVTAGVGSSWMAPGDASNGVMTVSPWTVPPPLAQQPGLRLLTYPHSFESPAALRGYKHTSYLPWLMAARHAKIAGYDDSVLVDTTGHVSETSHRNLFVWRDEELWTPPRSSGCLPGVMRGLVLEIAPRLGIPVREQSLALADARTADRILLTSAVTLVQSVGEWDEQSYATANWPKLLHDLEQELYGELQREAPGSMRK
jgi:branched-chain amino acid aminotransferase